MAGLLVVMFVSSRALWRFSETTKPRIYSCFLENIDLNGQTFPSQLDCRLKKVPPGQLSSHLMGCPQSKQLTRHCRSQPAPPALLLVVGEHRGIGSQRRRFPSVHNGAGLIGSLVDGEEYATAEPRGLRLHNAQAESGSNGSIYGISAREEDVSACLRAAAVTRRHRRLVIAAEWGVGGWRPGHLSIIRALFE